MPKQATVARETLSRARLTWGGPPADGSWAKPRGEWQKTEEKDFFSEILNYFVHFLKAKIGLNEGGKLSIFI